MLQGPQPRVTNLSCEVITGVPSNNLHCVERELCRWRRGRSSEEELKDERGRKRERERRIGREGGREGGRDRDRSREKDRERTNGNRVPSPLHVGFPPMSLISLVKMEMPWHLWQ